MADVIDKIIQVYVERRTEEEPFIDTFRRIGIDPFKERVYAANHKDRQVVDDRWHLLPRTRPWKACPTATT